MDIVLENVSKKYGDEYIFQDISYVFKDGSTTCIMGESGVGKTTLFRIIMGEEYDSGNVITCDDMSVVFQEDRLCENTNAINNVLMVLDSDKNKSQLKKEVEEELKLVLPEECLHKKVRDLSGGMKRRVAIVRAMMKNSKIVLLDEPFNGMDLDTRVNASKYVKSRKNGRTIIQISHNLEDSKLLEGSIYVLTKDKQVATMKK